jgi:hypothetical protein
LYLVVQQNGLAFAQLEFASGYLGDVAVVACLFDATLNRGLAGVVGVPEVCNNRFRGFLALPNRFK